MFIILLLFSFLSSAEELASEKYCFPSVQHAQSATQKFKGIQVGSDLVTPDHNCLTIQMRPHRREMIQRFVLSAASGARLAFSSEAVRREPCLLKVEKVKTHMTENFHAQLATHPQVSAQTRQGESSETMQIQTLSEFALMVNQTEVQGKCRFINSERYEITLMVKKNPSPVYAPTERPKDEETSTLQTQLQLTKGQRMEVGSIVQKLKKGENELKISPQVQMDTSRQESTEHLYLSLQ